MTSEDSCSCYGYSQHGSEIDIFFSYFRPSLTPHLFNPRNGTYRFSEPLCQGVVQVFSPSKCHKFYLQLILRGEHFSVNASSSKESKEELFLGIWEQGFRKLLRKGDIHKNPEAILFLRFSLLGRWWKETKYGMSPATVLCCLFSGKEFPEQPLWPEWGEGDLWEHLCLDILTPLHLGTQSLCFSLPPPFSFCDWCVNLLLML